METFTPSHLSSNDLLISPLQKKKGLTSTTGVIHLLAPTIHVESLVTLTSALCKSKIL